MASLTCSDGPEGKVYATARALFVAPKPHKALQASMGGHKIGQGSFFVVHTMGVEKG